jgi:type III restriction enzyme
MKILFDAGQTYQLDAINAVVDVFAGQPRADGLSVSMGSAARQGALITELGVGNALMLGETALLENVRAVQVRNGLALSTELALLRLPADATDLPPVPAEDALAHRKGEGKVVSSPTNLSNATVDPSPQPSPKGRGGSNVGKFPNFSIEMETGTGKTYVYLRTAFELHARYGFSKFIVVVPSVAIREGVVTSLRLMREHFRALYDNVAYDASVYDSKQMNRVRTFATGNTLQIMVLNIDAFNKASNVMHSDRDGGKPIEKIASTRPVVVIDEPQNMESELARAAIASLNPLCTLRYSATHRNTYTLLYKLDPVRAYDLKLVKRIEVFSVLDEPAFNTPYVGVKSVTATKTKLTAKIEIDVNHKDGPKRETITLVSPKHQADLFELSKGREAYRGWIVDELRMEPKGVSFSNGTEIAVGEATGSQQDDVMRVQVMETVREHFDKELSLLKSPPAGGRIKVLSLFFIDRVAHYADADGKIRKWFVEAYAQISTQPRYSALMPLPVESVHNGYFASVKGQARDSRGDTAADEEAYELIMQDKERLLSADEPLRFIFSHSALREGWDNPNVFQICTLNETKSEIKKRQEIGRGLRLPVMENGARCFDERINRLTVVANESYVDFAQKLQSEIEGDCGVSFSNRIANSKSRLKIPLRVGWRLNDEFKAIWEKIAYKTRYSVAFSTAKLIEAAAKRLTESEELTTPKINALKASVYFTSEGAQTRLLSVSQDRVAYGAVAMPDLIGYVQQATELTRSTIGEILKNSGRLGEVHINPQQFLDQAIKAIRFELRALMVQGVRYEKIVDERYDQMLFENEELYGYLTNTIATQKSIYEKTVFDSEIERTFAEGIEGREDILLCIKLPPWFLVETPVGKYNPDWAIVMRPDNRVYLVRETKGNTDIEKLAADERDKVKCGAKHFAHLGVDFKVVVEHTEVS